MMRSKFPSYSYSDSHFTPSLMFTSIYVALHVPFIPQSYPNLPYLFDMKTHVGFVMDHLHRDGRIKS